MILLSSLRKLIAIRSRTAYKLVLKFLPSKPVLPKPELELTLLTMCGSNYLLLLQHSLLSLYKSWASLPKLQIVSDGTITTKKLEEALAWWPGTKSFSTWEQTVDYYKQQGYESVVKFAENNIMGKKLAVILRYGELGPTLWCDSDILWFSELSSFPKLSNGNSLSLLKVSEDYHPSYDPNLIVQGQLEHLQKPPYINAGLMYINGNLIKSCDIEFLLELAAKRPTNDAEQTIFAEAAHQLGKSFWNRHEIACFEDDKYSILPKYIGKKWIARHYIGPVRHLFFRDALALRLGLKEKLFEKK